MPVERMYQQLSLGETLGKTFCIFLGHLDVFLPLALGVTVPMCLSTVLFVASLSDDDVKSNNELWDYFVNHLASCISYIVLQTLLYVILFFSVEAAMVRAAAEIYAGKSPHWYACFCHGLGKFCSLLCARLLVWLFLASTLVLVVGLCAALVQSHAANWLVTILIISYLGVAFSVFMTAMILYPVIMVERQGPTAALRRSLVLSRGMRCYFFCCATCLWIAKLILLGVLQAIFANASKLSSLVSIAGVIVAAVSSLFSLPLTTVLSAVMYFSSRARVEPFTRRELLGDLRIEPHDDDNNNNNSPGDGILDEREVPLLADTDIEVESPPLVENVIVVDEKEVPADVPEASQIA